MTLTGTGSSSMRRDIASGYAVSAARALSWLVVSALIVRDSLGDFALFALVRATIGILQYTSLGLAPALVHLLAQVRRDGGDDEIPLAKPAPDAALKSVGAPHAPAVELSYEVPPRGRAPAQINVELRTLFANGVAIALITTMVGAAVTILYALYFHRLHELPPTDASGPALVAILGFATLLRLASDAGGAVLQTEDRISLDNGILIAGEAAWIGITGLATYLWGQVIGGAIGGAMIGYLLSGVLVFYARVIAADRRTRLPADFWKHAEWRVAWQVLRFGVLVTLAQLANYLYAPTDYVLINWLIDPLAVAAYAPAVQIDGGLLLLVSGLAAVLLPKSALAYASGDNTSLRRYYVRGTLASAGLLAAAALAVWALSPWIFSAWLGDEMRATQQILPLILAHTVIGGSGAVGRSILIGAGKVRPLTAAVLVAAGTKVAISYCSARYLGWGLNGIVFGTICATVGCFAIWMPWYVLRTLRSMPEKPIEPEPESAPPVMG